MSERRLPLTTYREYPGRYVVFQPRPHETPLFIGYILKRGKQWAIYPKSCDARWPFRTVKLALSAFTKDYFSVPQEK